MKYTDYCSINEVEAEAATGVKLTGADGLTEEKVKEALLKLNEKGVTTWAVIHCQGAAMDMTVRNRSL